MRKRERSPLLHFVLLFIGLVAVFAIIYFLRDAETPPWRSHEKTQEKEPLPPSSTQLPDKGISRPAAFRFVSYNVKNWLTSRQGPPKSLRSKKLVIEILASAQPDVIGLSEIGSEADVKDIQKRLRKTGFDLPFFHYTGGVDPIRHLAILSRFPITKSHSPEPEISGSVHSMQRGILDVVLRIGEADVRFIGLHLKSKRTVPDADQALLRLAEAGHVRKYLDHIFTEKISPNVILYGDFNDHINSLSTRSVLGVYRTAAYLFPVKLNDSRGESWTHHFSKQDSYNRIDFVAVSRSLKSRINKESSHIVELSKWELASDHRALVVTFK